jgi:hypothetical protein
MLPERQGRADRAGSGGAEVSSSKALSSKLGSSKTRVLTVSSTSTALAWIGSAESGPAPGPAVAIGAWEASWREADAGCCRVGAEGAGFGAADRSSSRLTSSKVGSSKTLFRAVSSRSAASLRALSAGAAAAPADAAASGAEAGCCRAWGGVGCAASAGRTGRSTGCCAAWVGAAARAGRTGSAAGGAARCWRGWAAGVACRSSCRAMRLSMTMSVGPPIMTRCSTSSRRISTSRRRVSTAVASSTARRGWRFLPPRMKVEAARLRISQKTPTSARSATATMMMAVSRVAPWPPKRLSGIRCPPVLVQI